MFVTSCLTSIRKGLREDDTLKAVQKLANHQSSNTNPCLLLLSPVRDIVTKGVSNKVSHKCCVRKDNLEKERYKKH